MARHTGPRSASPTSDEDDWDGREERRALGFSIACALVLAALGVVIGTLAQSEIILFDGFYTLLGIVLSWLALRISRVVAAGPTSRYPFGREALTPLIIGVEGVALLATCAYATFNAILTIVGGGSPPPRGLSVGYAAVALLGPLAVAYTLRKWCPSSELVAAEATQWFAGGMLGCGMLGAFLGALVLEHTGWHHGAKYVDPVLVVVACALFVIPPSRMIRATFVELVEGAPDDEIVEPINAALDEVRKEFSLTEPKVRLTKVGRKVYVEIDVIVPEEWRIIQSDRVRRALLERLDAMPFEVWLTLEFAADPTTLE